MSRAARREWEAEHGALTIPPVVVHVLIAGYALCGIQGLPSAWPDHHRWVRVDEDGENCAGCVAAKAAR